MSGPGNKAKQDNEAGKPGAGPVSDPGNGPIGGSAVPGSKTPEKQSINAQGLIYAFEFGLMLVFAAISLWPLESSHVAVRPSDLRSASACAQTRVAQLQPTGIDGATGVVTVGDLLEAEDACGVIAATSMAMAARVAAGASQAGDASSNVSAAGSDPESQAVAFEDVDTRLASVVAAASLDESLHEAQAEPTKPAQTAASVVAATVAATTVTSVTPVTFLSDRNGSQDGVFGNAGQERTVEPTALKDLFEKEPIR